MNSNFDRTNNKTILKNTMFLYLRMLILLVVSLYTSRIVLQNLGFEDFGLYNVVGSVVLFISFIQGSLSTSASRFLSFEIGRGTKESLRRVFCMILNNHIIISCIILLIFETIGLWYVNNKLVIPDGREEAVAIVYQLSIISTLMAILVVPYRAVIISQERMKAFAYLSIVEVFLKLGIAICLAYTSYDKLVVYGFLLCIVHMAVNLLYYIYCRRNFSETKYSLCWDKSMFSSMFTFTWWSVFSYAPALVSQLYNLLLNLFFGPIVNAARAVSYQVQGQISQLVNNFQTALNPQIVKNYSAKDANRVNELVMMSAKISFSLLFIILMILLTNIDFILAIWLVEVPKQTALFICIIAISSVFSSFSNSLGVVAEAANQLGRYNIIVAPFYLSMIPVAYFALKFGAPAYSIFFVLSLFEFIAFYIKYGIVKKIFSQLTTGLPRFYLVCTSSVFTASVVGYMLIEVFGNTILGFLIKSVISILFSTLWIYLIILSSQERNKVVDVVKSKLKIKSE